MAALPYDGTRGRDRRRGERARHRGHDPQHRAAAPVDARRAPAAAHPRRRADRHAPSRSSATCTGARRSSSRSATTGRSSCWPTGTTGCRRSPTNWAWSWPSSGCWAWRCRSARSGRAPLLAELNRVLNHLMFLGSYPLEIGAITPIFYAFRERESIQAVMEEVSGGRMHYMFNRVGGLKEDLPAGWLDRVPEAVAETRRRVPRHRRPHPGQRDLPRPHQAASASCTREQVLQYGVSGPDRPRLRRRLRPAPRRAVPRLRRAAGAAGGHPHRRATATPASSPARPGQRLARPGRRVRRPAALAAAGPDQPAAAQGAEGAGGPHLRLDREPARHQRLLPRLPAATRPRGGSSCAPRRTTTSRCCRELLPGTWWPTWSPSSARCSSSSATSTSDRRRDSAAGQIRRLAARAQPDRGGGVALGVHHPELEARGSRTDQPARLHLRGCGCSPGCFR